MRQEGYLLIAGVDFGTSFSKVVIQSHGRDKGRSYAVAKTGCVLLPSLIGVDRGYLYGPMCRPLPGPVAYLKILAREMLTGHPAIQPPPEFHPLCEAYGTRLALEGMLAWYFANVVAATLGFIRTSTEWADFGDLADDYLAYQVCVPTRYEADAGTTALLLEGLRLGLLCAPNLDGSMAQHVRSDELMAFCAGNRDTEEYRSIGARCFAYPEVAAAVQTVMRAPTAQDGLYMTIDVGAGTVDMNLFRRYTAQGVREPTEAQKEANNLDYYAARVAFLGAARIAERREVNPFEGFGVSLPPTRSDWGLRPIPEIELMRSLHSELGDLFQSAQWYQRNLGQRWGHRTYDKCRIYAWGGGYQYAGYQKAVLEKLRTLIARRSPPDALPAPRQLVLPAGTDFGRLAVAYGLSYPPPDLERIRLPRDQPSWNARRRAATRQQGRRQLPPDYWTNPKYDEYM